MTSATDELLKLPPFGLPPEQKTPALLAAVQEQLAHHVEHCPSFARWCRTQGFDPARPLASAADAPFLPVSIFKRLLLSSIPESQAVRVLTSSGTSGQVPSRVPLDATTRNRQIRALGAILSHRLGGQRRPFLILDAPPEQTSGADRELSARVAGMRGYLIAASEQRYALRREGDHLVLDRDVVTNAVRNWSSLGRTFCLLGYTYMLYEQVMRPLRECGGRIELPPSTFVMHFGGWKKLAQQAVSRQTFTEAASDVFGLPTASIIDIYGFTEQLGVVYPDDSQGIKRTPTYSEVIVRDPRTLEPLADGQVGLLEFVCPLPHSYPGVAVLLDDMGRIVCRDRGIDGWYGTGFEVVGRAERAEPRGCGDTLSSRVFQMGSAR